MQALTIVFPIQGYRVGDVAGFDDVTIGRDGRTTVERLIAEGVAVPYVTASGPVVPKPEALPVRAIEHPIMNTMLAKRQAVRKGAGS